jgi:uncharacterized phiE125 gp8 family phage protein
MTYIQTAGPAVEPLTLAEARAHLRLDTEDEDALLLSLIVAAREHLERETGLSLVTQEWRHCLDRWPADGILTLAHGPVRTVTSVIAHDGEGMPQAVPLDGHLLDGEARPARLWLSQVPQAGRAINGIEVEFEAGFGMTGAEVPDTLKRAMLLHLAAMYAFRGVVAAEAQPAIVPPGYDRLIAPFCRRRL